MCINYANYKSIWNVLGADWCTDRLPSLPHVELVSSCGVYSVDIFIASCVSRQVLGCLLSSNLPCEWHKDNQNYNSFLLVLRHIVGISTNVWMEQWTDWQQVWPQSYCRHGLFVVRLRSYCFCVIFCHHFALRSYLPRSVKTGKRKQISSGILKFLTLVICRQKNVKRLLQTQTNLLKGRTKFGQQTHWRWLLERLSCCGCQET